MVEFKFIEYGTDFGTRDMGMKLREKLLPLIKENDKVVLDFTGVNVVSNSFADECIAKLLLDMPLSELKQHTTFRGLNPMAERSVLCGPPAKIQGAENKLIHDLGISIGVGEGSLRYGACIPSRRLLAFVCATFSRFRRNLLLSFLRHDGKLWRFFLHVCLFGVNFAVL